METLIEGRTWVVGDCVTTDAMYPAFAMKLPLAEAAKHVSTRCAPAVPAQLHQLRPAGRRRPRRHRRVRRRRRRPPGLRQWLVREHH
jgi:hypothetical protein